MVFSVGMCVSHWSVFDSIGVFADLICISEMDRYTTCDMDTWWLCDVNGCPQLCVSEDMRGLGSQLSDALWRAALSGTLKEDQKRLIETELRDAEIDPPDVDDADEDCVGGYITRFAFVEQSTFSDAEAWDLLFGSDFDRDAFDVTFEFLRCGWYLMINGTLYPKRLPQVPEQHGVEYQTQTSSTRYPEVLYGSTKVRG